MTISKKEQIANKLILRVKDFPPLPGFITKIMQLNADPESALVDIARVVEAEVSLAATILKLVNSSFFGVGNKVSSVSHAISLLGRNELMNLVLTSAMFQSYEGFKYKKQYIAPLRLHCFKCGIAARYLGEKVGHREGDLFLAGLVHDVGKIFIYQAFSESSLEKLYNGSPLDHDDIDEEEKQLGIGHNSLGAALLASWEFPAQLQIAVEFHHQPDQAEDYSIYPLIIHTADLLIRILDIRENGGKSVEMDQKLLGEPRNILLADAGLFITEENLEDLLEELGAYLDQESDLAEYFYG